MNQQKIGSFLKSLRRERGLTQEQLAEQLNVSNRTVSRWETGANMPDIGLLLALSAFYGVSISEIIDGERKGENVNDEIKQTALKLSDYSQAIHKTLKKRLLRLTIAAFLGMVAFAAIEALGLDTPDSLYEKVASTGLGLGFGTLAVIILYMSGLLDAIKARRFACRGAHGRPQ